MFRPKLAARTVSVETALPCLDSVSKLQGFESAISEGGSPNEACHLPWPTYRSWPKAGHQTPTEIPELDGFLIASAIAPVLLRLSNGNMILSLRNKEANPTQVVVSDPLYEIGKPFLLPQNALEQAWAAEALIVEPQQSKAERAVALLIWVLSVCRLIAGAFFLADALRQIVGS